MIENTIYIKNSMPGLLVR